MNCRHNGCKLYANQLRRRESRASYCQIWTDSLWYELWVLLFAGIIVECGVMVKKGHSGACSENFSPTTFAQWRSKFAKMQDAHMRLTCSPKSCWFELIWLWLLQARIRFSACTTWRYNPCRPISWSYNAEFRLISFNISYCILWYFTFKQYSFWCL